MPDVRLCRPKESSYRSQTPNEWTRSFPRTGGASNALTRRYHRNSNAANPARNEPRPQGSGPHHDPPRPSELNPPHPRRCRTSRALSTRLNPARRVKSFSKGSSSWSRRAKENLLPWIQRHEYPSRAESFGGPSRFWPQRRFHEEATAKYEVRIEATGAPCPSAWRYQPQPPPIHSP